MELLLRLGLLEHSPHSPRVPYGGLQERNTVVFNTLLCATTPDTRLNTVCDYHYIPGISHTGVEVAGRFDVRLVTLDDMLK